MMTGLLANRVSLQPCSLQFAIGYNYFAMGAYFDRDTVALPGCSKYFTVRIG